jgi:hypothetical protein
LEELTMKKTALALVGGAIGALALGLISTAPASAARAPEPGGGVVVDGTGPADWNKACQTQFNTPQYRAFPHPQGVKCGVTGFIESVYPNWDLACDSQYGLASYPVERGVRPEGTPLVICER